MIAEKENKRISQGRQRVFKKTSCLLILFPCIFSLLSGKEIELTIYKQNFFLVHEKRDIRLDRGINEIELTDIPPGVEEKSVKITSLTDTRAQIIEQSFRYDLISSAKIWYKFLNRWVKITTQDDKVYEGYLIGGPERKLSYGQDYYRKHPYTKMTYSYTVGNLLITRDLNKGPIISIPIKDIKEFPEFPDDFVTTPTLFLKIKTFLPGIHRIDLTYLASGIDWHCDYNALVRERDSYLDISAWITIDNHSGMKYEDAKISLVTGDVHKLKEGYYTTEGQIKSITDRHPKEYMDILETPEIRQYQLDLSRKTTLLDGQARQFELIRSKRVKVNKFYCYDGARYNNRYYMDCRERTHFELPCNQKVNIFLEFHNNRNNNLGISLPLGKVMIFKKDKKSNRKFLGEDVVDRTSKDECVRLFVGNALDISGERIKTKLERVREDIFPDGAKNKAYDIYDERFRITLRNQKKHQVNIIIYELLHRWSNWRIVESSHKYVKRDKRAIEFPVKVSANDEIVLTYTVRYWW